MDVYHGIPYLGVVPVLVRSTTDGEVSIDVNGEKFTGQALTSVKDGLVLINVTGLLAGEKYSAAVRTPNETETITLRPFKESGKVKVGFFSCGQINNKRALHQLVKADVDCVVSIGDEYYPESNITTHGVVTVNNTSSLINAKDLPNYYAKHRLARREHALKQLVTSRGYATVGDDHDFGINDLVWTLANFQLAIPSVVDLDDMREIVDASAKSIYDYGQINPPNTDADVDVNPFYKRFYVGEHLEVFIITSVIAGFNTGSSNRLVRPDTGDMLTALEESWLLNTLKNSDRTFKLILSPKMTFAAEFNQEDFSVAGRSTQRDRILSAIHEGTDWKVFGGVIWGSGDFHTPSVHATFEADAVGYDHVNVCACPAGQDGGNIRNAGVAGTYTRKHFNDLSSTQGTSDVYEGRFLRCVGIAEVDELAERIDIEVKLSSGVTWWKGGVKAGENKLSYPVNLIGQ